MCARRAWRVARTRAPGGRPAGRWCLTWPGMHVLTSRCRTLSGPLAWRVAPQGHCPLLRGRHPERQERGRHPERRPDCERGQGRGAWGRPLHGARRAWAGCIAEWPLVATVEPQLILLLHGDVATAQSWKVGKLKALVKVGRDNGLPLRVTGEWEEMQGGLGQLADAQQGRPKPHLCTPIPLTNKHVGTCPPPAEVATLSYGGVSGISDTAGAAIWALDIALEIAAAGATGVHFHQVRDGSIWAVLFGAQMGYCASTHGSKPCRCGCTCYLPPCRHIAVFSPICRYSSARPMPTTMPCSTTPPRALCESNCLSTVRQSAAGAPRGQPTAAAVPVCAVRTHPRR